MNLFDFLFLAIILGVIIKFAFWGWIISKVFESGSSNPPTFYGNANFGDTMHNQHMVNIAQLIAFQQAMMALQQQMDQQANYHALDKDFNQFNKMIQELSKQAKNNQVPINPQWQQNLNHGFSKIMQQSRELERLDRMHMDNFKGDLMSKASQCGLDPSFLY